MEEYLALLIAEARLVGVEISVETARRMLLLLELVAAAPLNLTSVRSAEDMRRKHLVDSLSCLPVARLGGGEWCVDLGSGGGFPGLPVAIACPWVRMDLVEATGKKVAFLEGAVARLGLANVLVRHDRAEALGRRDGWRDRVDCVLARAVAPLPVLMEYALPLCRAGGRLVALKGIKADEEMAMAQRAANLLGGTFGEQRRLELPGGGRRVVVRVDKTGPTPGRYPRAPGVPARRPL